MFDGMTVKTSGTLNDPILIQGGLVFELTATHGNSTYYLSCVLFDDEILGDYEDGDLATLTGVFGYYENMGHWQIVVDGEENISL